MSVEGQHLKQSSDHPVPGSTLLRIDADPLAAVRGTQQLAWSGDDPIRAHGIPRAAENARSYAARMASRCRSWSARRAATTASSDPV